MIHLCNFSGGVTNLKPVQHTDENILAALQKHPRLSIWDLGDDGWGSYMNELERKGLIVSNSKDEPFPWVRFEVTPKGIELLTAKSGGE